MKQYATNEPTYLFATIGALTERGGRVTTARGGTTIQGLGMACVGDVVTYPDGSEAVIRDGAGSALVIDGRPAALVGSSLSTTVLTNYSAFRPQHGHRSRRASSAAASSNRSVAMESAT